MSVSSSTIDLDAMVDETFLIIMKNDMHENIVNAQYVSSIVFFSLFLYLLYLLGVNQKPSKISFKIFLFIGFVLSLSGLVLAVMSLYEPKGIDDKTQFYIDNASDYINIIFVVLIFFGIFMFVVFKLFTKKLLFDLFRKSILQCVNENTTSKVKLDKHIAVMTLFLIMNAFAYIFLRIFSEK